MSTLYFSLPFLGFAIPCISFVPVCLSFCYCTGHCFTLKWTVTFQDLKYVSGPEAACYSDLLFVSRCVLCVWGWIYRFCPQTVLHYPFIYIVLQVYMLDCTI